MVTVVVVGVLVLAGIIVICVAAYIIDAESFEIKSRLWKIASVSIKIKSSRRHSGPRDPRNSKLTRPGGTRPRICGPDSKREDALGSKDAEIY